ncbi:hypothetical protein [Caldisericum exile]|uniref:Uncharacterized protein n=1 Tax=Caldisericum exile (strain DSM 21853 / NBRC 104410 / AZM16c01) TaxID=511051 RepID=A0A7U6GDW9_CALEA|nr:hypothetical protein [Caldisericum exile]BAL80625.1 hypothetical protein CSE_04990 [Caldisericum exile AZM16c01]
MFIDYFNNFMGMNRVYLMLIIPIAILVILLIFAIITAVVAHKKGRNAFGWFILGLLTGPIGLAIILVALPIHYYIKSGDDDL